MRTRLFAAVRCLLADESLRGAPDRVRLAAVVLLAKAPARSTRMRLRAREMGRWLGFSESYVDHTVLPAMREAGVATAEPVTDEAGRVTGLEWQLLPLNVARESGDPMHPLALLRKDLATLLRLCEALFGPGWAPTNGPVTPPGLLGGRRGRGAATDRLALLLLVLQTRSDGRVRLVGGSVKEGRGRADATVARALGCSVSGGGKVIDRLARQHLVEVVRGTTATGQFAKSRLMVPAVAAAHGRGGAQASSVVVADIPAERREASCPSCAGHDAGDDASADGGLVLSGEGWLQESFDDVEPPDHQRPAAAPGNLAADQQAAQPGSGGGVAPEGATGTGVLGRPAGAPLHADHAPVVKVSGSLSLSWGFSGEADLGSCGLPERGCAREGGSGLRQETVAPAGVGEGDPLRGEQHIELPDGTGQVPARAKPAAPGYPAGKVVFARPVPLPDGLETVLAPVRSVWERIDRMTTRRHVAAATRVQLARLRGVLGPQYASGALAERLERRLVQQMGRPVTDPVGWILGRGLPQRAWCWSPLCDEGRRMDSGADCPSCQVLIGDRRGMRARIAAATARDLPEAAPEALKAETHKRLSAAVADEAAAQVARRERALADERARAVIVAQRRAEHEEAEQARLAQPCTDCGVPEAGGLCLLCTERRRTERALIAAVDFAVMARADLADPRDVADVTARCTRDTRALVEQVLERLRADGTKEADLVLAARETAEKIRDRRRESLHGRLMRSAAAEAEADKAYDTKLRYQHRYPTRAMAIQAAERAAEEALLRTVEFLLADRSTQLRVARGEQLEQPAVTTWSSRFACLAAQGLIEDRAQDSVIASEAVSAA
ncbi:hypothetical protein [Streptomyces nigrescens]|uniref:hypothetical protein n=1 Tax=Streptomyces nigrescens TaxID=1920 RepID=UPI0036F52AD6